ncbi:MAG: hypothetical protein HUU32_11630 [Calditrichaceae bacterium]|nr:DUF6036 family nucleotidyltransferase [Calditrichia bacterium]NUQ42038.1 hypothetical protein [Calditrichaceae bacterium]
MEKEQIELYLQELNDELHRTNVKGEVCLYGGAVMCLVYDARPSTKDVDAIFKPAREIREAAKAIAEKHNLREDWINDAVKGFVVEHPQKIFLNLPNLKVFVPEPDYLLAMKAIASRVDAPDKDDIRFLIDLLEMKTPKQVFEVLEKYYPRQQIKPATQFFIEELFEQ